MRHHHSPNQWLASGQWFDRRCDPSAAEHLLPLVYDELRKLGAARMANEDPGQTLQATALVHEAFVRLVDVEKSQKWESRGHFFAAAAKSDWTYAKNWLRAELQESK